MKKTILLSSVLSLSLFASAEKLLLPMDNTQTDHMRAYGIVFAELQNKVQVNWLLNYKGGAFIMESSDDAQKRCADRGVSFVLLNDKEEALLNKTISDPASDMKSVPMVRVPKIAVHTATTSGEWDDPVQLVLRYAGIPFDTLNDEEILQGKLMNYDWLHVHHEDFTGQHGRFYSGFNNTVWYKNEVAIESDMALRLGYTNVPAMKLDVAKHIRSFVEHGGCFFAMCSATDSYDIALASEGVDIAGDIYDGDPMDVDANTKLNYDNCFAFQNFAVKTNPYEYESSNIDTYGTRGWRDAVNESNDYFMLNTYSATEQTESCMLTQDHATTIKGFWGQTTAFNPVYLKPDVVRLGTGTVNGEARYIHGDYGDGMWTFMGGHDPEDYMHFLGETPTDISKVKNSPAYRLILNNVLFASTKVETPAACVVNAFPNPAADHLKITFTGSDENSMFDLKLFDATGKMVMALSVNGENESELDVTALTNGTYLLMISKDGESVSSQKIEILR